jgi:diacylglycerol kinase family enzyme
VDWSHKKKIGPLAYVIAGLKALRERQPKITVRAGGQSVTGEFVLVGNGRFYGGPVSAFPQADLRDGLLDICILPRLNWWTLMRCAPGLLTNRKPPASIAQFIQAANLTWRANPGRRLNWTESGWVICPRRFRSSVKSCASLCHERRDDSSLVPSTASKLQIRD